MRHDSYPYNPFYDDAFFTPGKGFEESCYVFIQGNRLEERIQSRFQSNGLFTVGEIGFGTGLNLWTLLYFLNKSIPLFSSTQAFRIRFITVEERPLSQEETLNLLEPYYDDFQHFFLESYISQFFIHNPKPGWNSRIWSVGLNYPEMNLQANHSLELEFWLWYGQAKDMLQSLDRVFQFEPKRVDAWFLDGHDPKKNPEAWSSQIFEGIWRASCSGTTLATYTAAGIVKQGLRAQGFIIQRKKGFDKKHHMICGYRP